MVTVLIILAVLLPYVFAADVSLGQVGTITLSFQQPPAGVVSVGDTVLLNVRASGYDLVAKPVARVVVDKLVYDTTRLRFLGLRNGDNSEMCGGTALKCVLPPPAYFQFLNPDGQLPLTWYPMSVTKPLVNNVPRIATSSTTNDPADYFSRGQHTLFILAFEAITEGQATISADASTIIKLRPSLAEYYTPARVVPASIAIAAACGNGRPEPDKGEECDLGAANNDIGTCNTQCQLTYCGDGTVQRLNGDANGDSVADAGLAEQCDDGNQLAGDFCTKSCQSDRDADGVIDDVDNCPFGDGDKVLNEAGVDNNRDQTNTDNPTNDLALENPLQGDVCDADDDGDGVSDAIETQRGMNPLNGDSDSDGICDGDVSGLDNPIFRCAKGEDLNVNGVVDAGETDPTKADTDTDGLCDAVPFVAGEILYDANGQEICRSGEDKNTDQHIGGDTNNNRIFEPATEQWTETDPLNRDSDADTVSDGDEIKLYGTTPTNRDTDGDGLEDWEAAPPYNMDPLSTDSDGDGLFDAIETAAVVEVALGPQIGERVDTDRDGVLDALEVDSDGDGLCDGNLAVVGCVGSEDKNANGVFERQGVDQLDRTPDDETNRLVADTDGDAANDQIDTCPTEPNADQLDTDGDATEGCNVAGFCGNACDRDADNDLIPGDVDGDGIINRTCKDGNTQNCDDNCLIVANPLQENFDGDAAGDAAGDACDEDDDNDGVDDVFAFNNQPRDICSFTPRVDANGNELFRTVENGLVQANGCMVGDMDADGCVNNVDVAPFVTSIAGGGLDHSSFAKFLGNIYSNWQVGNGCDDGPATPPAAPAGVVNENTYDLGPLLNQDGSTVEINGGVNQAVAERGQRYKVSIVGRPRADNEGMILFGVNYNPAEITILDIVPAEGIRFRNEQLNAGPSTITFTTYVLPDSFTRERIAEPTHFADIVVEVKQGQKLPEASASFSFKAGGFIFNAGGITTYDFLGLSFDPVFRGSPSVFTVAPTRWCKDSDGNDPSLFGKVQIEEPLGANNQPQKFTDSCSADGQSLQEFYCEGTVQRSTDHSCTVGLVCVHDPNLGDACVVDTDDDGIPDLPALNGVNGDNCPTIPNPDQHDNDNDFDPLDPDGANPNKGGDACDDDDDNDTIPDVQESGSWVFVSFEGDLGTESLSRDTDMDGFEDHQDNCPVGDSDGVLEVNPPVMDDADGEDQTDTDGDKLGDFCDPDDDGDLLTDADEVTIHRTNPLNPDTDSDGLNDKLELDTGTNPTLGDTDGDRLGDGSAGGNFNGEDINVNGIVDPGETDPRKADTDGDGLNEFIEADNSLNPLVTDSDGDTLCDGNPPDRTVLLNPCVGFEDRNNDGIIAGDTNVDGLLDADEQWTETNPDNRDSDGDGLDDLRSIDNCPLVANADQIDSERDGQGDACDTDDDNDNVNDDRDNCPFVQNNMAGRDPQRDSDGDRKGDACDICAGDANDDSDGDGYCAGSGYSQVDKVGDNDNCPDLANADQLNTDGANDGGDACDVNDDNDQNLDVNDCAPLDPAVYISVTQYVDADGDGIRENEEAQVNVCTDGNPQNLFTLAENGPDNCPDLQNPEQLDFEGDRLGNVCDPDDDNDSVDDGLDCAPTDATKHTTVSQYSDGDRDGVRNGDHQFGNICTDGNAQDGFTLNAEGLDNCLETANADQLDTDGDGSGDACDVCINDAADDRDNDGICVGVGFSAPKVGENDNCPDLSNPQQADGDQDGFGNACDVCPLDPTNDADGDFVCEGEGFNPAVGEMSGDNDNCPAVNNPEQMNTDGVADGGDACDDDDDNDTHLDDADCAPLDGAIHTTIAQYVDTDGDGVRETVDSVEACTDGNAQKGFTKEADGLDNCPTDQNADQADVEGDGLGDACDLDNDNDGVNNEVDNCEFIANGALGDSCAFAEGTMFSVFCNQSNVDGDAQGDACDEDDDGDSINDVDEQFNQLDNCPLTANADQKDSDGDYNACDFTDLLNPVLNDGSGNSCGGDACDDTPCGDNADLVAGACTCREGFLNDNAEWGDGCEAVSQVAAVDSDNDGVNDSDEPAACVGVGETGLVGNNGCYYGDENVDGIVSSSEYTVFKAKYRRNINNLQETIPSSAYTIYKAKYRRGLIRSE